MNTMTGLEKKIVLVALLFSLSILFCLVKANASELEPNYNRLADAIRKAEGNANYGILAHYEHTSYRQACINTCKHKYAQWLANSENKGFLEYLSSKYCPVGASNDPTGLNRNWLRNVRYFYERL